MLCCHLAKKTNAACASSLVGASIVNKSYIGWVCFSNKSICINLSNNTGKLHIGKHKQSSYKATSASNH